MSFFPLMAIVDWICPKYITNCAINLTNYPADNQDVKSSKTGKILRKIKSLRFELRKKIN